MLKSKKKSFRAVQVWEGSRAGGKVKEVVKGGARVCVKSKQKAMGKELEGESWDWSCFGCPL